MQTLPLTLYQAARLVVALKPQIIDALGIEALHFIDDNFEDSAWHGEVTEDWPKRKKEPKGLQRKLLVDTAALRTGFAQENTGDASIITNDLPYAKIHNEGGTINMPSRAVILNYTGEKGGKLKLASVKNEEHQRKITEIRRGTRGEHKIEIPSRRFIDDSPVLDKRCINAISNIILNALKQ